MYGNKLAAAIKVNGRVLKEFKDTVYVKFGSEYSVYMKNLNTTRALVNVFIDGTNITPGGLVINAGQEVDLQRSIANGNLTEGNSLRFIERTGNIEKHRGVKLEDGLIRIEFQFEMPVIYATSTNYKRDDYIWDTNRTIVPMNGVLRSRDVTYDTNITAVSAQSSTELWNAASYNETGITVPGSKSEQKFQTASVGALDPTKHTIILKILGETPDNKPVREPVTTKHKPKCVTCGKQNKATAKFCAECGTALTIIA